MAQQQLKYEHQAPASTLGRMPRLAMFFGPMLVGSFLPIWTVWYIGSWEATGHAGMLWTALRMLPDNVRAAGIGYVSTTWLSSNIIPAGVLLLVGFWVERFFVARGRRDARKQVL